MKKSDNQIAYIGNELDLFKNAHHWKKYFSKKIQKYIKGDVLEVGAGIGVNTKFLSQNRKNQITSWTLLEPDKELSNQINQHVDSLAIEKIEIINGIIDDVNEHQYDTIIYIDVIEHIEESKIELKKASSMLKTDGHLIILAPAFNFLFSEFDKEIGHFRRYNKKLLNNEINNELKKEKIFYLDSIGFFASLANKWFLKKETPTPGNIRFWDNILIRLSKVFDPLFLNRFGKSLIGIYRK